MKISHLSLLNKYWYAVYQSYYYRVLLMQNIVAILKLKNGPELISINM